MAAEMAAMGQPVVGVTLKPQVWGLPLTPEVEVMVFVSGWPDSHDMWEKQIEAFGDKYHILTITTPDFDRLELRRPWGYTPKECVELICECIDNTLGAERKFILVGHDWGAVWSNGVVAALGPKGRIVKFVALDVGNATIMPTADPKTHGAPSPCCNKLWILLYQSWFAFCFWVGMRCCGCLANCLLKCFTRCCFPCVGPLGCCFSAWDPKVMPRPMAEVEWWMCYPYYQVLRRAPSFAKSAFVEEVPTMYIWGNAKRSMFHGGPYVAKLNSMPGCKAIPYECNHWIMHEMPEQLNKDMKEFLSAESV